MTITQRAKDPESLSQKVGGDVSQAMRSHQSIQSHLLLPNVTIVEFTADKYMVVESSGQVAIQVSSQVELSLL
eukprot:5845199-Amphidinium_carterae.1